MPIWHVWLIRSKTHSKYFIKVENSVMYILAIIKLDFSCVHDVLARDEYFILDHFKLENILSFRKVCVIKWNSCQKLESVYQYFVFFSFPYFKLDIALLNNFQVDTFRHYCLYSHFLERVTKEEKTLASAWPEELKLKQLDNDLLDDEDDDYYEEDYEEDDNLFDDEDDDDYYDDEEYH